MFGTHGSTEEDIFSLSGDEPRGRTKGDSDVRLEAARSEVRGSTRRATATPASTPTSTRRATATPASRQGQGQEGRARPSSRPRRSAIDFSGPGSAVIKGGSSSKLSAPKSSGKLTSGATRARGSPSPAARRQQRVRTEPRRRQRRLRAEAEHRRQRRGRPRVDAEGSRRQRRRGGESGINLRDPADSGISLEKGKGKGKGEGAEAQPRTREDRQRLGRGLRADLDSLRRRRPARKLGGPKSGKKPVDPDSDSEFELTLDDSAAGRASKHAAAGSADDGDKGDIFETDFEIPPMEPSPGPRRSRSSRTPTWRSPTSTWRVDSDVRPSDESGSEVVLLEDEEARSPARGRSGRKPQRRCATVDLDAASDVDDEDESAAATACRERGAGGDDAEEEEEEEVPVRGGRRPAPWGADPGDLPVPRVHPHARSAG